MNRQIGQAPIIAAFRFSALIWHLAFILIVASEMAGIHFANARSERTLTLHPKGEDSRIKNAITKYDNNQVALNP